MFMVCVCVCEESFVVDVGHGNLIQVHNVTCFGPLYILILIEYYINLIILLKLNTIFFCSN